MFFFFFPFLIDHMVFHRSSTCITPFFESIKWYFWLIRPLWTTSARLISTCPKDSYIKKKKKERIRLGQRFNFLCRRIHCRSFIKRIKTNKIEVGITYIIWGYLGIEANACPFTHNLYVDLVLHRRLFKQELELFVPHRIARFPDHLRKDRFYAESHVKVETQQCRNIIWS